MVPWYDTSTTTNYVSVHYRSYVSPSEAQRIADEREMEQHRQERAFIRRFMPEQVPVVPRFHRPLIVYRPEFHARSHPRPAALRPRRPEKRKALAQHS